MKNIFLFALVILFFGCGTQKIISYEYSSLTRGYKMTVKVEKDSTLVTETINRKISETKSATDSELWKSIEVGARDIELFKIGTLVSPTNMRQIDAAMFSKLILTTEDSIYTSSSFDNGHPPAMLKIVADSLVNLKGYK
jgi:hypothetical protein